MSRRTSGFQVHGSGFDLEPVDNPRTFDTECPACERRGRFVERELVKNLRVLGIPLVGIERGGRAFECPCKQVYFPVDMFAEPAPQGAATTADASVAQLRALRTKLEDEAWLWRRRAQLARERGETQLAVEALELCARAEDEIARIERQLTTGSAFVPAVTPAQTPVGTPTVLPTSVAAPAATAPAVPGTASTEVNSDDQDDFASLKAKLMRKPVTPAVESAPVQQPVAVSPPVQPAAVETVPTPAPVATVVPVAANTPLVAPPVQDPEPDISAEFAALKARLARGVTADPNLTSDQTPDPPGEAPSATVPGPDDDDPLAALKKSLRKP